MKKILCIVLVIGIIILSGCSDTVAGDEQNESRFISIEDDYYYVDGNTYRIMYDSYTDIVYLVRSYGITVLYNSDKEPMTIDEYYNTR